MATVYSSDNLRAIFQSSFNLAQWYTVLQNLFQASELKSTPEKIINNTTDEGYYLGCIDTTDGYRIGLFHYKICQGSVANKRVGLRNLVKSFINPTWGEFEGALVVFDSGDHWRLSFISDIKGEATSPKRYTYVFGNNELLYRTPIERFNLLQKKGISFENLKTAFSVEALSDEFFDKYRNQYADFIQYVTGKRYVKSGSKWEEKVQGTPNAALMQAFGYDEKKIRDYIKKMMGRITFLHFLQRKGWMCGDLNYMQNMFNRSAYQHDYLDAVLEPLFFGVLNTKPDEREAVFRAYNWDLQLLREWKDIPYLNGGLFERDAEDEPESCFPADYFQRLFQFFSEYNFTIDENDPNDAEVGVDPEMLGKIFENLLEDNKDKGAFYTPKEIVRYMCQESLIAYLDTNTSIASEKIRKFVLSPEEGVTDIPDNKKPKLLTALEEVKICDPAIGSGAFPMGLLNELLHCREVLSGEHYDRAALKKSIIQNNIYGVDIEKGAVDIARLRFWLSIVVDEETPSPLPNLDYKIMQGNSLIESFEGIDLSELTYKRESKKDKGEVMLFDDEKNRHQKIVSQLLTRYYSCSDHTRKLELQREIAATINTLLESQAIDASKLAQLKQLNLAETNQFFLWYTWFSDVFNREDEKSGFDIVIGNPPYVRRTSLPSKDKALYEKTFFSAHKQYDLYLLFIEKGLSILSNKGSLCFINPLRFFNSDYGLKARQLIIGQYGIRKIVDISQIEVFKNAMTYPCILQLLGKGLKTETFNFIRVNTKEELVIIERAYRLEVDLSFIKKDKTARFLIGDESMSSIVKKIELKSNPLSKYFDVARGLPNNKVDFNSNIHFALKSTNVRKYHIEGELHQIDTEYYMDFADEMIIMPRTVLYLQATLKDKNIICLDRIYYLKTLRDIHKLKGVLGVINSTIINYWFEYNYWTTKVAGGYFDLNGNQILSIPIPIDFAIYDKIAPIVEDILHETNNINIKKIDDLLYQYYDLTDDEIKIVEQCSIQ